MELITASNIMFALGLIGTMFTVYFKLTSPQSTLEKKQIVVEEDLKDKATVLQQEEVKGKADILAKQVEWEKNANEKRFGDFSIRLDSAMAIAQNHIHTVDVKCDKTLEAVNILTIQVTKLETIINERIPRSQSKV